MPLARRAHPARNTSLQTNAPALVTVPHSSQDKAAYPRLWYSTACPVCPLLPHHTAQAYIPRVAVRHQTLLFWKWSETAVSVPRTPPSQTDCPAHTTEQLYFCHAPSTSASWPSLRWHGMSRQVPFRPNRHRQIAPSTEIPHNLFLTAYAVMSIYTPDHLWPAFRKYLTPDVLWHSAPSSRTSETPDHPLLPPRSQTDCCNRPVRLWADNSPFPLPLCLSSSFCQIQISYKSLSYRCTPRFTDINSISQNKAELKAFHQNIFKYFTWRTTLFVV